MNHYIAFIKVIELGSFTKAAEHLGYTQSGISMLIKSLEEEVRTKLIIRSRTGISLTSDGEQLVRSIKNIVQTKEALEEAVARLEGMERAHIRIGILASVLHHYIAKAMKDFKEQYPKVTFELILGDYSEIEQMIKEGTVDFGFIHPEVTTDLSMVPFVSDEYVVCIPLKHRLTAYPSIALNDLNNEGYILIKDGSINPIQQYFQEQGISLNIICTVSEDRLAIELIKKGLGVSVMPSLIVPPLENQIIIRPLTVPKERHVYIGFKQFDMLPIAARKFIHFIKEQLLDEN
jgi:DNA-binding transcriptional LysR family regulator